MMKGIDNKIFLGLLLISFIIGILLYDNTFDRYSDMITFLSIMHQFQNYINLQFYIILH